MKKVSLTQTVLVAVVSLAIGFLIGFVAKNYTPAKENLAGSIGKVDRYRNVKVSEEDLMLRNELVADTIKRMQYEKYLTYYYYQSLQTASDLKLVTEKTASVTEFAAVNEPYLKSLTSYQDFLEKARLDIFSSILLIKTMTVNENIPVIQNLNQAQNVISRIRTQETLLSNYMESIASFLDANPDKKYDALEDAHDILVNNLVTSAVMTQNKPALKYLDHRKMMNDKEGMKQLAANNNAKGSLNDQVMSDLQQLNSHLMDSDQLKMNALDSDNQLKAVLLNSQGELQVVVLMDTQLSSFQNDVEQLRGTLCDATLNMVIGSEESLRFADVQSLNAMVLNSTILFSQASYGSDQLLQLYQ
jgi:hypothetical protein